MYFKVVIFIGLRLIMCLNTANRDFFRCFVPKLKKLKYFTIYYMSFNKLKNTLEDNE